MKSTLAGKKYLPSHSLQTLYDFLHVDNLARVGSEREIHLNAAHVQQLSTVIRHSFALLQRGIKGQIARGPMQVPEYRFWYNMYRYYRL